MRGLMPSPSFERIAKSDDTHSNVSVEIALSEQPNSAIHIPELTNQTGILVDLNPFPRLSVIDW
jgi:hypothetical protein